MARENFLWGAPRIHGELLMLGFTVSQATVSRYMPPANWRRGQSWRTFIRNEALAFRRDEATADDSVGDDAGRRGRSHSSRPACFEAGQHRARRPLAVSHRSVRVVSDSGQVLLTLHSPTYRARALPLSRSLPLFGRSDQLVASGVKAPSRLRRERSNESSSSRRSPRSRATILTLLSLQNMRPPLCGRGFEKPRVVGGLHHRYERRAA